MKLSPSHSEQPGVSTAFTFQRLSLAACILLAPLSITLYLISWPGNQRAPLTPLIASAMASPTGNTLHFIGAIAASFFLPLGYLGMSLLGMRRAPPPPDPPPRRPPPAAARRLRGAGGHPSGRRSPAPRARADAQTPPDCL